MHLTISPSTDNTYLHNLSSTPPLSHHPHYLQSLPQQPISFNNPLISRSPTNIVYPHHSKHSPPHSFTQSFHHIRSVSQSPERTLVYPSQSHSPPSHHSSTIGLNAVRNNNKENFNAFLNAPSTKTASNYKVIDLDDMCAKNGGTMSHDEFDDQMHALLSYRDDQFVNKNALDKAMIDLSDEYNRFLDRNVLDLHFLTREQSKAVLKKRLDEIKACKRPKIVYIVTGRGNHSIDNDPVIKKYVQEVAAKKKFKCEEMEGNGGVLVMNCRLIRK
ncbi:hypothetical protein PRIPAC_94026 [Pristionchus pacificus]|uniref:Smr domain-containing protein n=1 Tax=Pristionchus pacificus TaxID=54126 RepID=A0A454XQZ0_PRIPA|nr:hypothetical protein PRIPAC_94026 [Pristionchus pacificus]|eukprot:PDM62943.1 hypothetical protein PRIPAC_50158 [Pristionchus pacificus]